MSSEVRSVRELSSSEHNVNNHALHPSQPPITLAWLYGYSSLSSGTKWELRRTGVVGARAMNREGSGFIAQPYRTNHIAFYGILVVAAFVSFLDFPTVAHVICYM